MFTAIFLCGARNNLKRYCIIQRAFLRMLMNRGNWKHFPHVADKYSVCINSYQGPRNQRRDGMLSVVKAKEINFLFT
jgi:hypothetical protein